jgi:serine/threonine-protein kinase
MGDALRPRYRYALIGVKLGSSRKHSRRSDLPKTLFGYNVIDYIGEGAASDIYSVSDPDTHQLYALKHVVRKTDKHTRFIEQLEAEHEVGQRVRHPGLRRTFDLKFNRSMLFKVTEAALIMELVDGRPLEFNLPGTLPAVLDIFIHTARALDALHGMGYVHCDLKPNNILVDSAGRVKVIDLGQACKIGTRKQRIQGTPDYISPEQVKCLAVTMRTDVYNFGATMYWALTGKKLPTLFTLKKGENSFLSDGLIQSPRDVSASNPEQLSNLVMECVRTNPSKRPNDLSEIAKRLEIMRHSITRGESATRQPPPPPSDEAIVA